MSGFKPAVRERLHGRVAIDGISGSGKSVTGLILSYILSHDRRIGVIDTEHRSVSKYVGEKFYDIIFDRMDVNDDLADNRDFSPERYTDAINKAGKLGYPVLFIDSLSHAWQGEGGALELKDKIGNSFYDWKNITPMHNRMVNAILAYPGHVIVTMRSKSEYVTEKDEKGKTVVRKVGMAPIQRSGMEYEFDLYCTMDIQHLLRVTKTRCRAMDNRECVKPGPDFFQPFVDWLESGVVPEPPPPPPPDPPHVLRARRLIEATGLTPEKTRMALAKYGVERIEDLTVDAVDRWQERAVPVMNEESRMKYLAFLNTLEASAPLGVMEPANGEPAAATNQ